MKIYGNHPKLTKTTFNPAVKNQQILRLELFLKPGIEMLHPPPSLRITSIFAIYLIKYVFYLEKVAALSLPLIIIPFLKPAPGNAQYACSAQEKAEERSLETSQCPLCLLGIILMR